METLLAKERNDLIVDDLKITFDALGCDTFRSFPLSKTVEQEFPDREFICFYIFAFVQRGDETSAFGLSVTFRPFERMPFAPALTTLIDIEDDRPMTGRTLTNMQVPTAPLRKKLGIES
ncbi:MAG: hypothetical protein WA728_22730 [Xanthobacteraceae bacterium]